MAEPLDDTDRAILRELRTDSRASMNAVAAAVNISRANAYARVKRMTESGVIRAHTVRTDPVLEGFHASAYVGMSVDQSRWQRIRTQLTDITEVEHVALLGGEFDVLVLVRARDNRDLKRVVLEQLQAIEGIRSTRTFLIFEDFETQLER